MTIEVWSDVGGTFTDCFVTRDGRCRVTKVLSSGVVRAAVIDIPGRRRVQLRLPPLHAIDRFWVGARLSEIGREGNHRHLGTVTSCDGASGMMEVDCDLGDLAAEGTVLELDPGLEAPVLAVRLLLGIPPCDPLPHMEVRLGTTRGTNALLTRGGARTALLVTGGFQDLLRIGEQDRPDLFALSIRKPSPLTEQVLEIDGRLDATGRVLAPIDESQLRRQLTELWHQGVESLAICLLHAHVDSAQEEICERVARELGFDAVSRSSEVAPLIKLISRAETTTLDAYLNPVLSGYVERVWDQFGGRESCRLRLMTSGGNLVAPVGFRGRDSILSGPAGGVVALADVAESCGVSAAIGLDMGGTSTDVSRHQGRVGRRYESRVAGLRVMTPMMDIHTIAAGGGSICDFRGATSEAGGRLIVGPESAGADPGPACYGRGGPLTLTDVNLLLGRVPVKRFPFPLDRDAALGCLEAVAGRMPNQLPSREALAEGFFQIAVTHMAEAVRAVSTAEGCDAREMSLVGFGGAAGQHLCRVAATLGMAHIIDHPDAAMLSALGIGLADVGRVVARGIYRPLTEDVLKHADAVAAELRIEAEQELRQEHNGSRQPEFYWECDLRYVGTESSLQLDLEPKATLAERFANRHRDVFGYHRPERQVELVAIRCEATLRSRTPLARHTPHSSRLPVRTRFWDRNGFVDGELIDRDALREGDSIVAPCMIASDTSTLIVEPGWQGVVGPQGVIELVPVAETREMTDVPIDDRRDETDLDDPVLVEVVARRLQGIAEAMGETLRRTSVSVNVKQRRDYSCAVFRRDGALIANAPHVPVHLGAMGHTVRRMMQVFPEMSPGDCYLSNDPYAGGSHLPDVTLVTPVFVDASSPAPDFFVASRAHHAEVGGRTPGSMPPEASSLAEEGVVIRDFPLVRYGTSREDRLRELLSSGPFPSRSVEENLADVAAQQAAGYDGQRALVALARRYGARTVDRMMGRLVDLAGDSIGGWIETLPERTLNFVDYLDDGTPIRVRIERQRSRSTGHSRLTIDFSGTGAVHPHGFNATPSIVTAAVMYVLRSVTGSELPLCEGVLRDVDLLIPAGLLNPPPHESPADCAAVVAGNVETSQRIVDVLLGALGVAAASQGTMNNLLIGDETFGYYETIGGGSGATAAGDGADAVHTHMTNTRITDAEVLESRLPLRLHAFLIRRDSGGKGDHNGGDGIIREIEFLRPLTLSLITSRRTTAPYGAAGGQPGMPGTNRLIRDGHVVSLGPTATIEVLPGDRLRIETPGGGGWGKSG